MQIIKIKKRSKTESAAGAKSSAYWTASQEFFFESLKIEGFRMAHGIKALLWRLNLELDLSQLLSPCLLLISGRG